MNVSKDMLILEVVENVLTARTHGIILAQSFSFWCNLE